MAEAQTITAKTTSSKRLRPWILGAIGILTAAQIVVLSPSSLEESGLTNSTAVDPASLVETTDKPLATGIPTGKIPDYSVDQFNYVSTQGKDKLWKLLADRTYLYRDQDIVHSRVVTAYLYDPDGKTTVVTGKESKYFTKKRDLEVFGDVKVVMPDGFELHTEYLKYKPQEKKIEIPADYAVKGIGAEQSDGQRTSFDSHGFENHMKENRIVLPSAVTFYMENTARPEDKTKIESDRAIIHRDKQIAYFTMSPSREESKRFVYITQPELYTRAREADLNYGDASKVLNYLVAREDVLIKETGKKKLALKYGTSGRADFDAKRNVIVMREFPQVYQDNDTVTGEVIVVHRDTDIVEVEHSNAFSEGSE